MAFSGYLIKFGDTVLPNNLLKLEGWNSTPNQRLDSEAERDADMLLHRSTSANTKTKIVFQTKDSLTLAEKMQLQAVINAGMVNLTERKVNATYWNDETNDYVTSATGFYIPDINFVIERISGNDIIYKSAQITLIEY